MTPVGIVASRVVTVSLNSAGRLCGGAQHRSARQPSALRREDILRLNTCFAVGDDEAVSAVPGRATSSRVDTTEYIFKATQSGSGGDYIMSETNPGHKTDSRGSRELERLPTNEWTTTYRVYLINQIQFKVVTLPHTQFSYSSIEPIISLVRCVGVTKD